MFPRNVSMHMSGNERVDAIVAVMRQLADENLGVFHERYSIPPHRDVKRVFMKRPTYEIYDGLETYGIRLTEYEDKFQQHPQSSSIRLVSGTSPY